MATKSKSYYVHVTNPKGQFGPFGSMASAKRAAQRIADKLGKSVKVLLGGAGAGGKKRKPAVAKRRANSSLKGTHGQSFTEFAHSGRGGSGVIGHTQSGKPVHDTGAPEYESRKGTRGGARHTLGRNDPKVLKRALPDWTAQDHQDAARIHADARDAMARAHGLLFPDSVNAELRRLAHGGGYHSDATATHHRASGKRTTLYQSGLSSETGTYTTPPGFKKNPGHYPTGSHNEPTFDTDQERLFDEVLLTAENDGRFYEARNYAGAVDAAIREIKANEAQRISGDLSFVREHAVKELRRRWGPKSKSNPAYAHLKGSHKANPTNRWGQTFKKGDKVEVYTTSGWSPGVYVKLEAPSSYSSAYGRQAIIRYGSGPKSVTMTVGFDDIRHVGAKTNPGHYPTGSHNEPTFDTDQEALFDEVLLTAENDGRFYEARNYAGAVDAAIREIKASEARRVSEDLSIVRAHAVKELRRRWGPKSKSNPAYAHLKGSRKGKANARQINAPKAKRAPGKYAKFVKSRMPHYLAKGIKSSEAMKAIGQEWRSAKAAK